LRRADGGSGVSSGAVSCVLTPEMTEGPFYVSGEKVRSNITSTWGCISASHCSASRKTARAMSARSRWASTVR